MPLNYTIVWSTFMICGVIAIAADQTILAVLMGILATITALSSIK